MTILSSMQYPYWLMIAGALLLMLGFVGLVLRNRSVEAGRDDGLMDQQADDPEAGLTEVEAYNRAAKEKRRERWAEDLAKTGRSPN